MNHTHTATRANVRIRPLAHEDIENLRLWRNDPTNCRWLRKIPHITPEEQELWWQSYLADEDTLAFATVEEGDLRRMVGSFSLHDFQNDSCEFGRFLVGDPDAHGRGVGFNAVLAALEVAFFQLGLDSVFLHVFAANEPAVRAFERVGFVKVGSTKADRGEELTCKIDRTDYIGLNEGPGGARALEFVEHGDERGHLVVAEAGGPDIPFDVKRVFYIYGSDADVIRGRHANRRTEFVLINVSGSSRVKVDDGRGNTRVYELDHPHMGVYLPSMVWKDMYGFSADSVLLVLASEHYDASEYIRDYDEFVQEAGGRA